MSEQECPEKYKRKIIEIIVNKLLKAVKEQEKKVGYIYWRI